MSLFNFKRRSGPELEKEPENRFTVATLTSSGVSITCPGCGAVGGCNVKMGITNPFVMSSPPILMVTLSCKYCRAEIQGGFEPKEEIVDTIVLIFSLLNDWFPALTEAVGKFDLDQHKEKGGMLS